MIVTVISSLHHLLVVLPLRRAKFAKKIVRSVFPFGENAKLSSSRRAIFVREAGRR
jgi:hypothetical protein